MRRRPPSPPDQAVGTRAGWSPRRGPAGSEPGQAGGSRTVGDSRVTGVSLVRSGRSGRPRVYARRRVVRAPCGPVLARGGISERLPGWGSYGSSWPAARPRESPARASAGVWELRAVWRATAGSGVQLGTNLAEDRAPSSSPRRDQAAKEGLGFAPPRCPDWTLVNANAVGGDRQGGGLVDPEGPPLPLPGIGTRHIYLLCDLFV